MIDDYRGLLYRSPLLGGMLIFFLVSLVGIPFTGGFFGKFYSFSAAVGGGAVWLAIIGLLNSGLAAAYYLRPAFVAAQKPDESKAQAAAPRAQVGIAVGAALALAVLATLILGIAPGEVLRAPKRERIRCRRRQCRSPRFMRLRLPYLRTLRAVPWRSNSR
jgi:NADH-quinone oxidoreductase subunit N